MTSSKQLAPGTQLGRYEIVRPLGSGAMGDVYLAADPQIERHLAIKTVRPDGASPEQIAERRERLLREARAAGKLVHPHVVTLFDTGEQDGLVFLAFEFVEGETLESRMARRRLSVDESLDVVRQVASALAAAHDQGIVHRDIKPANILLNVHGTAKVADFGIAKLHSQATALTHTGTVIGSPQYMSPEQVMGDALDGRTDQFSLGSLLYELLVGKRAFGGGTITTLIYQILNKPPAPLASENPNLPQAVIELTERMMNKERDQRFPDMHEVVRRLETLSRTLIAEGEEPTLPTKPREAEPQTEPATVLPPLPNAPDATELLAPASTPQETPPSEPPPPPAPKLPAPVSEPSFHQGTTSPSTEAPSISAAASSAGGPKRRSILPVAGLALLLLLGATTALWFWRSQANRAQDTADDQQQVTLAEQTEPKAAPQETSPTKAPPNRSDSADNASRAANPTTSQANTPKAPEEAVTKNTDAPKDVAAASVKSEPTQELRATQNEPAPVQVASASPNPVKDRERTGSQKRAATTVPPQVVVATPDEKDSGEEAAATPPPTNTNERPERDESNDLPSIQVDQRMVTGTNLRFEVTPKNTFVQVRGRLDRRFIQVGRIREFRRTGYNLPKPGRFLVRLRAEGRKDWLILIDAKANNPPTTIKVALPAG